MLFALEMKTRKRKHWISLSSIFSEIGCFPNIETELKHCIRVFFSLVFRSSYIIMLEAQPL